MDKDLRDHNANVSNAVYEASRIIEDLEHQGLYEGNGHHARQDIASMGELLFMCGSNQLTEEQRQQVWGIRKLVRETIQTVKAGS